MKIFVLLLALASLAQAQPIPKNQRDALNGANGQTPSGKNRYVCDQDPRLAQTGLGTIVVQHNGVTIGTAAALNFEGTGVLSVTQPATGTAATIDMGQGGGGGGAELVTGAKSNLFAAYSGATSVTVTADAIDASSSTATWRINGISLLCDLSTSGAGGLDTGTIAASTFYDIVLSAQDGGASPVLLAKLVGATLTKPSGYVTETHLCYALTDGSAHVRKFYQSGQSYYYDGAIDDGALYILTNGTATSFSTLSLASLVPAGIREVTLVLTHQQDGLLRYVNLRPTGSTLSMTQILGANVVYPSVRTIISSSRQIDYKIIGNATYGADIVVAGWVDPR